MADWYLVPCLKTLFAEFDQIAPGRDHASDGSIGDAAHQAEKSDHNPDSKGAVHAIDVDSNLNAPFSMEDVIQYFVAECRKNSPNGNDRGRLKYFIYNRRIWSASTGWKQESYTGSSPHTEHAHFSCEYASNYENDTNPWGLIPKFGDDMPTAEEIANAVWNRYQINGIGGGQAAYQTLADTAGRTNIIKADTASLKTSATTAQEVLTAIQAQLDAIKATVEATQQAIDDHVSGIIEGEQKPSGS